MPAGRPFDSKTPLWRNSAAIKVVTYRFLMAYKGMDASKSGCARYMSLSRTTVIKWWHVIEWTEDDIHAINKIAIQCNPHYFTNVEIKRFCEVMKSSEDYIRLMIAVLIMLYDGQYIRYWHISKSKNVKEI